MDEYVEYEEAGGCIEQIKGAFAALLIAPILILVAGGVLFWNEGRAVKRARDLAQGQSSVVSIAADEVDPAMEGKLVHVNGELAVDETLKDPTFGVSAKAVELKRSVEMYQWEEDKETKTVRRNGKEYEKTTYRYEKQWASRVIDSGSFKRSSSHRNPAQMPFESKTYRADTVRLGAFTVGDDLIDKVSERSGLPLDPSVKDSVPASYRSSAAVTDDTVYLNGRTSQPSIGDVRVRFSVFEPQPVSLVAAQTDGTFTPYASEELYDEIALIETGKHSADEMFQKAKEWNTTLTWILRIGGWLAMLIGFSMFFAPLEAFVGAIPLVGWLLENLVEVGTFIVSFLLASALSLVIVAVGWIFYRPILGILLLLLAGGLVAGLIYLSRSAGGERSAAA